MKLLHSVKTMTKRKATVRNEKELTKQREGAII